MTVSIQQLCTYITLIALCICGCSRSHQRSTEQISGATMGTTYRIKYLPESTTPKLVELSKLIDEELVTVNLQMSTYQDDSELAKFNSSSSTDWQPVSQATIDVVSIGLKYHELSNGAFDVTVGPLVNLWGFGPDPEPNKLPREEEIRKLLESVGSDKLQVRTDPPSMRKMHPNCKVDLSAIAKGHAVDRVSRILQENGVINYFVEIGGEVRVAGTRQDGQLWQIGIEQPNPKSREIHSVVAMKSGAIATSGNYRNFYNLSGRRLTHFIDPKTGDPIDGNLLSATVIMDDCASADAAATTLMVIGAEAAQSLIAQQQWSAMLIIDNGGQLETITSPKFQALIQP